MMLAVIVNKGGEDSQYAFGKLVSDHALRTVEPVGSVVRRAAIIERRAAEGVPA